MQKIILFLVLGVCLTYASTTTGLPGESPLETIKQSITGPVAFGISLLGIVAAGAGLIWGGELSGFIKTMIYIVLVIAVIISGTNIMNMFSAKGLLI